ncbi:T9SS type A sorting domain-containing protein [Candidatus Poribacteria bacterium]|nr:T9SS type A sorting domain-containing protein [Candidatus Poribacteria bacterium]
MRFKFATLLICLILVFALQMSVTEASSPPSILVYQGAEVNLSVKVTNTGKVPLEGVQARLDLQPLPTYIQPVESPPKTVSIPASTSLGSRPYGNVQLQFRVSKLAPVGDTVIPFEITDHDGTMWKKFVHLKIQEKPARSMLLANYPNPLNPETWIPYQLDQAAAVRIQIYDVSGRLVRTLDLGDQEAGIYFDKNRAGYWDGKNNAGESLASGVYFYSLYTNGGLTDTRQMLLLK